MGMNESKGLKRFGSWTLVLAAMVFLASCGEDCQRIVCASDPERLPIVPLEELDEPLCVLESATPHYPEEARRQGHEGTVVVRVLVGADGSVEQAVVEESSTYEELDEAAVAAALQFRFSQPRRDGCPVRTELTVPFRFILS